MHLYLSSLRRKEFPFFEKYLFRQKYVLINLYCSSNYLEVFEDLLELPMNNTFDKSTYVVGDLKLQTTLCM